MRSARRDLDDPERLRQEKAEDEALAVARPVIRLLLAELFGSPEHPRMPAPELGVIFVHSSTLTGQEPPATLVELGRLIYKKQCMRCHGFYGFGDGADGRELVPRPRDFRFGKVKFTSTKQDFQRPSRRDLVRTVVKGLPGTACGPHEGLSDERSLEVFAVASYVEVLLMRGSVEQALLDEWRDADSNVLTAEIVTKRVQQTLQEWQNADKPEAEIVPEKPRPADFDRSARRGAILFGADVTIEEAEAAAKAFNYDLAKGGLDGFLRTYRGRAGCTCCHGVHGLGVDSPPEDLRQESRELAEQFLLQPNDFKLPSRPTNLTRGVYAGGKEPIDLYRRLAGGITGTMHPRAAVADDSEQVWNVVDYVYRLGGKGTK